LPAVQYVLNTTVNRDIGVSAMGYAFGREPTRLSRGRMPQMLRGDNWSAILNASLKAMQRVRTAADYRRYTVEVRTVMRRNAEQRRKKTTEYEANEAVWVWFHMDSKKQAKVDASARWRRGVYVRLSHSRRSHWVYVGGRLFKKSDMHVHPRVPTLNRCLAGRVVTEVTAETSDESDVEEKIRQQVREQRRRQDDSEDAQWIEYYNVGSNNPQLEGEIKGNSLNEVEDSEDVMRIEDSEEKEEVGNTKAQRLMEAENVQSALTWFTILENDDDEDKKERVLTLQVEDGQFHCFTRTSRKKPDQGRWRYQPTFYEIKKGKTIQHYSDKKKENYKDWVLELDGWRIADRIRLPYHAGEYFSVSETEKIIIEKGREHV